MVMLGTDMKVAETPKDGLKDYTKADPYTEWLKQEGVKVYEEFYFPSLAKIELGPWERKGGSGAVVHIDNRHMPNDCHVVEIKPGGKSEPEHHMYELTIYVVSGRGATTIWQDEKQKKSFEWQAGSLFSIPLNAWYQNFNGSGNEPTRYIAVTNAPPMMRLFRDSNFIFNCDYMFSGRYAGEENYFSGKGKLFNRRIWESNFIANAPGHAALRLEGARRRRYQRHARNGRQQHQEPHLRVSHRHLQEGAPPRPRRASGTAQRHRRLFFDLDQGRPLRHDQVRLAARLDGHRAQATTAIHQHFNSGTTRARYLALRPGRYGLYKTARGGGGEYADRSMKEGGWQVEYEDEDREIHKIFEKELKANGATCKMKAFVPWCTGEVGPTSERDT